MRKYIHFIIGVLLFFLLITPAFAASPLDTLVSLFQYKQCTTNSQCKAKEVCSQGYCLKQDGTAGSYCGAKAAPKCNSGLYCQYLTDVCIAIDTSKILVSTDITKKQLYLTWVNKNQASDKISAVQVLTKKAGKEVKSYTPLVMNQYNPISLDTTNLLCGNQICADALVTINYGQFAQVLDKQILLNSQNCFDYDSTKSVTGNKQASCSKIVAVDGTSGAYCGESYYTCKSGYACASGYCVVLVTETAATCTDGIQNQGEAGKDCGGPCKACQTCTDGINNQDEKGVDCGGTICPNLCPTCFDGIQNQGEAGKDCGGPCAKACETCFDTKQNQNELGVDCGGVCVKQCPLANITIKCAKKVQKPDSSTMPYDVCQEEKDCPFASYYCKSDKTGDSCATGCNSNNDCKADQKCDLTTKSCVANAIIPTADFTYTVTENKQGQVHVVTTAITSNYAATAYTWKGYFPKGAKTPYTITGQKSADFTTSKNLFPSEIVLDIQVGAGQIIENKTIVQPYCLSVDYCDATTECSLTTATCEPIPAKQTCSKAEDCLLLGYYCDAATSTCKAGCDSNVDCSAGQVCDISKNKCLAVGKCARLDDCTKAGQNCNLATNTCEKGSVSQCKTDADCVYAGTYCVATDQVPGSKYKGICSPSCSEDRDCKYYQHCVPSGVLNVGGTCTNNDFTADFSYNLGYRVGNYVFLSYGANYNQFPADNYQWRFDSGYPFAARASWDFLKIDKFPINLSLNITVGGVLKSVTQEINIKCDSAAYCRAGYTCNLAAQKCEQTPKTQKCNNGEIKNCPSNDNCVERNSTTGLLECYAKDQVITIIDTNTTGGKEKKDVQCGAISTWCPKGFYYDPVGKYCSLYQGACFITGQKNTCGPDSQLTFGWFTNQYCFAKDKSNDQACCVISTVNNVDYYEYNNVKVY